MTSSSANHFNLQNSKSIDETQTKSVEIDDALNSKAKENDFLSNLLITEQKDDHLEKRQTITKPSNANFSLVDSSFFNTQTPLPRPEYVNLLHVSVKTTNRGAYFKTLVEKCSNILECVRQVDVLLNQSNGDLNEMFRKSLEKFNVKQKRVSEEVSYLKTISRAAILTWYDGIDIYTRGYLSKYDIEFNSNEPKSPYRLLKDSLQRFKSQQFQVDIKKAESKQTLLNEIRQLECSLAIIVSPINNCVGIVDEIFNETSNSNRRPQMILIFSSD